MKSGARGVCDGLGEQVLPARDAVREELLVCCVERLQLLICYLHDKGRCDVQDDHRGLEVDRGPASTKNWNSLAYRVWELPPFTWTTALSPGFVLDKSSHSTLMEVDLLAIEFDRT